MKSLKKLIPILAVAVLTLAACSGGGGKTSTPSASGVPNTGGTPLATAMSTLSAAPTLPTISSTGAAVSTAVSTSGAGTTSTLNASPIVMPTSAATLQAATASPTSPSASSTETSLSTMVATSGATAVTSGAIPVIPSTGTGAGQLVSLAAMLKYRVVDNTGAAIGTVSDYVVNVCEAHILYAVVTPNASLNLSSGQQLLIPYEAFLATPNSGKIDAGAGVLTLNVAASSLSNAPAVSVNTLDLQNPGSWETNVQSYWRQNFRLSLTTGCRVPVAGAAATAAASTTVPNGSSVLFGTVVPTISATSSSAVGTAQPIMSGTAVVSTVPAGTAQPGATGTLTRENVYRIGLASQILTAPVQEYNGNPIAQTRDIAVIVQTGGIMYYVVQPASGAQRTPSAQATPATPTVNNVTGSLIALPPGAVNIRYQSNASGPMSPVLVLLAQANVFLNAPAFDATTGANASTWFNYWQKYVPMTQSQLP